MKGSKPMSKTSVIMTTVLGLILSAGLEAAPAYADSWTAVDTSGPPPVSAPCVTDSVNTTVCYQDSGDVLWLRDGKNDGHHAEMVVMWFGGVPIGICKDFLGTSA